MEIDCTIERNDGLVVVAPEGDVDVATAAVLRQILQQVIEAGDCTRLHVDMHKVTFLDSTGLGMFVAARRAAQARGIDFRLQEPGPMVRMLLEVTNLNETLTSATPANP